MRAPYRDRDGLTFPTSSAEQSLRRDDPYAACAAGGWPNRKSVSSTHIRCMMIASLRATATHAFFTPTFFASFMPHARSTDHFRHLLRCALAASYSAWRINLSPHLLMWPERSISPD